MEAPGFDYVAFRHGFGDRFAEKWESIAEHLWTRVCKPGQYPHVFIKGEFKIAGTPVYSVFMEEPLRRILGDSGVDQEDMTAFCITAGPDTCIPIKIGWEAVHCAMDILDKQNICLFIDRIHIGSVQVFTEKVFTEKVFTEKDRRVLLVTLDTDSV